MAASQDYHALLQLQRDFYRTNVTKQTGFRIQQLKKLHRAIQEFTPKISTALYDDLHRGEAEAWAHEIGLCLNEISYVTGRLKKWMRPRRAKGPKPFVLSSGRIMCEPYGSILIISPWNYPFLLALMPLIGAMAAGNCVVVKPSEITSRCAAVLEEMIKSSFDREYIAVVQGAAATATELLKLQFDYIFFTGSKRVGKMVMAAAAARCTPVTLELGGKSPCIIDAGCNLQTAVRRIVWGKFINAGQMCVAPDYLLVQKSMIEATIESLKAAIIRFYGKNPRLSADYGRVVSRSHFKRLSGYLEEGTVVFGGDCAEEELYMSPTLMTCCGEASSIMTEEIFGPVLPIVPYDDLDEAIAFVNRRPKPLALYLFSKSGKNINKVVGETSSGGVGINDTVIQIIAETLPFGGVGASGMGKYHGEYTYRLFSNVRSMVKNSMLFDFPRFPPYRPVNLKLIKMIYK